MITGAHFLFYSQKPEDDRAFLRDILGFKSVDVGGGWLIFALPPAEIAVHPDDKPFLHPHADQPLAGAVLYLMCDDLPSEIRKLEAKQVKCAEIDTEDWGSFTTFTLPSGGRIGLYQPTHPVAIGL